MGRGIRSNKPKKLGESAESPSPDQQHHGFGPQYTDPELQKPLSEPVTDATVTGIHSFNMPGWDHYSTWGYDEGDGYLHAQLYRNHDNRDERPTIWITPGTGYSLSTIDQIAEAIAFVRDRTLRGGPASRSHYQRLAYKASVPALAGPARLISLHYSGTDGVVATTTIRWDEPGDAMDAHVVRCGAFERNAAIDGVIATAHDRDLATNPSART